MTFLVKLQILYGTSRETSDMITQDDYQMQDVHFNHDNYVAEGLWVSTVPNL